jgi:hypothetical protein
MRMSIRHILIVLCLLAAADAVEAQTAFYRAPSSEIEGTPGTLIRQ